MQRPQPEHRAALMRGIRAAIFRCSLDCCFIIRQCGSCCSALGYAVIRDPVLRRYWIAGQARNDKTAETPDPGSSPGQALIRGREDKVCTMNLANIDMKNQR